MSDRPLVVHHAVAWAEQKSRVLDADLLTTVLELRHQHDDLADGDWPRDSAQRLLLTTWPAHGPDVPDLDVLRDTLDTFWGFLRATGRMRSGSASPGDLRKEAKRSLPRMQAAYDDPARHSQGRVLADFGRTIGIDLDEPAADLDELKGRLAQIQDAWNALPTEERRRRMPDPSPKGNRAAEVTALANSDTDADEPGLRYGDLAASAEDARESGFLRSCLELVEWIGAGREVTAAGLLRPAVARDAYRDLELWQWDRGLDEVQDAARGLPGMRWTPETEPLLRELGATSWRSAGDCLALDRLWHACEAAGLVDVRATRVYPGRALPGVDEEWRTLAMALVMGLCLRLGEYRCEPLAGLLLMAALADEPVPLVEVREWWESRCPEPLRGLEPLHWQGRLDELLFHFADCALWTVADETVSLTELGHDVTIVYLNALEEGLLGEGGRLYQN